MDTINALGGMLNIPQWFVWRLTWDQEENKFQKVPCYPDGSKYRMDASDSTNWQTFSNARNILQSLRARNDGFAYTLGFWLSAETGYWFFDIDKCVSNGQLSPLAQQFAAGFNGAAWEWSSSGTGLHIFGRGVVPEHRRKDIHRCNLEFYTSGRGIAFGMSGQFFGNAETDHSAAVAWLVENYFPPAALPGEVLDSTFDTPDPAWSGPADDAELIARIRRSERMDAGAVFAGLPAERATFSDLYDGRMDVLNRLYAGASDMDYALIGILSFWTGRDAVRTERIMRTSALYRDKWESRRGQDSYIRYSILRQFRSAYSEGRAVYGRPGTPGTDSTVGDAGNLVRDSGASSGHEHLDLVTVTTADPNKYQAVREAQQAFVAAGTPESLESAALLVRVDPRITPDVIEGLANDLMARFEQLQTKRRIRDCRALLTREHAGPAPGQHRQNTEFGNVDRMLDKYGNALMFVDETEQWFQWDSRRWALTSPHHIGHLAMETINGIYAEARDEENDDVRNGLLAWARDSQKSAMVKNMVSLARSRPQVFARAAVLDSQADLLGAPNGVIDLTTGALLAPDPHRRITQSVAVDYDMTADCPWFKQTVREAFFDDIEMVTFFKRLMGYCLMSNPKHSYLVIPYGHGANGKSTIMNAISRVVGDYSKTAASETFTSNDGMARGSASGPREDLLRLRTARMLFIGELDESAHLREHVVKMLTGDDTIIARGVNARTSVEFKPRFVPIMSTNHRPIIKGSDNGIWRRILMIPFERNFKEDETLSEDVNRPAKIAMESRGILRWLIEGALEYQRVGLCVPAGISEARDEYRDDMDILKDWIDTRCVFESNAVTKANDLFISWQQYAQPKGLLRMIGSSAALGRKLSGRKGFKKAQNVAGMRGRCWIGVRLKTAAEITFGGEQ